MAASLAAAVRGQAVVDLIADGVHLADATVSMVLDLLGPDATVLVSDAMAARGMPDGRYRIGDLDAVVAAGTARLREGGAIAGSTSTLLDMVRRRCVQHAGVPLLDAIRAASVTPAAVLGVQEEVGRLAPGLRADVLAVDPALHPVAVWRAGHRMASPTRLLDGGQPWCSSRGQEALMRTMIGFDSPPFDLPCRWGIPPSWGVRPRRRRRPLR